MAVNDSKLKGRGKAANETGGKPPAAKRATNGGTTRDGKKHSANWMNSVCAVFFITISQQSAFQVQSVFKSMPFTIISDTSSDLSRNSRINEIGGSDFDGRCTCQHKLHGIGGT